MQKFIFFLLITLSGLFFLYCITSNKNGLILKTLRQIINEQKNSKFEK